MWHALGLHGREQDGFFLGVMALVGELAHEGDDVAPAGEVRHTACRQFLIDGAQAVHHLQDVVMLVRELVDGVGVRHGEYLPDAVRICRG